MSYNYGKIGYCIGRELGHGFETGGRDTWNTETITNFEEISKCMIYQFSQYKLDNDTNVNGTRTLSN